MAWENVLLSPKIAPVVLAHLSPGPLLESDLEKTPAAGKRQECQSALARLARVCRAISSPALDVLWEHIDEFRHALFALKPYDKTKAMFTDNITDADWSRFQEYALRVRALHLGDVSELHTTVWILLTRRCPQGPLLPRLENLTGFKVDALSLCCTTLFSPSIRRLELQVSPSVDASVVRMAVQAAQPALSAVHELTVDGKSCTSNGTGVPVTIPYWTLSQLHTLTVVHESTLTIPILESLAAFPSLRKLELRIKEVPKIQEGGLAPGFARLADLKLCGRLGDVCAFVAATAPPNIDTLAITVPRLCAPEDVEDGIRAQTLSRAVRSLDPLYARLPASLRRFDATLRCDCTQDLHHFPDGSKLLSPLRAISGLRSISFTFDGTTTHLADKALCALHDAWPELVALELSAREPKPKQQPVHDSYHEPEPTVVHLRRYSVSPPCRERGRPPPPPRDHPTIKTLATFAKAHPRLERLALLSLDLDEAPDLATVPLLGHELRHLSVSKLESGIGLYPYALALDMLFPGLELADVQDAVLTPDAGGGGGGRNTELRLLLLALQTGRLGRHRERGGAALVRDPSDIVLTRRQGAPPPSAPSAREPVAPTSHRTYGGRRAPRSRSPPSPRYRDWDDDELYTRRPRHRRGYGD
ncbi:hypothetical protein BV20DRAFT_971503 [Pilatotrama ljubarskyi]|nr:hypothetical protein BV20DRAFT_971503 [Pilatotrama ljubarskyi]